MEYWKNGRNFCWEGGRIDRRTAIRRPSHNFNLLAPIIPLFHHSNIPIHLPKYLATAWAREWTWSFS